MRVFSLVAIIFLFVSAMALANEPILEAPAEVLSLSGAPSRLAVADLDGDGDDDLVICGPGPVYWAENTGGDFTANSIAHDAVGYDLGDCAGLGLGDVDDDGLLDIGYTGPTDGGILYQRQSAPWQLQLLPEAYWGGSAIVFADHQQNGTLDLFVALPDSSSVDYLLNTGTPLQWQDPDNILTDALDGTDLAVLDVDGDGQLNVVVPKLEGFESYHEEVSVWGHVSADILYHPLRFELDDLDGDGDSDAVFFGDSSFFGFRILWVENVDGELASYTTTLAQSTTGVFTLVDLDQDGVAGVVAQTTEGLELLRWAADGWTSRLLETVPDDAPAELVSIDADGDGDLDLLLAGASALYLFDNITPHARTGFVRGDDVTGTYSAPDFIAAGDFDSDGDVDLVISGVSGRGTSLRTNDGGSWSLSGEVNAVRLRGRGLVVDFDGDGDLDVIGGSDSGVYWLDNDGTVPWPQTLLTDTTDTAIALGDLDNDGDPDVVVGSRTTGAIDWVDNVGWTEDFGLVTLDATWSGLGDLKVAELNGDGELDVAATQDDGLDYELAWYENQGDAVSWQRHTAASLGGATLGLLAGDIDDDGLIELVTQSTSDGSRVYDPGADPTSGWSVQLENPGANWETRLESAADLDFDGDLDWFAPAPIHVVWVTNQTASYQTTPEGELNGLGPHTLVDVDSDGDLDFVAPAADDDVIGVWLNRRSTAFGDLTDEGRPVTSRARPATRYLMLGAFMGHGGLEGDLDLLLVSFEVRGTLSGLEVDPLDLAEWLDVTFWLDDGNGLFEPEVDMPQATVNETLEASVRLNLPEPVRLVWGSGQFAFVTVELNLDPFQGAREDLVLTFRGADLAFGVVGYDAPICHSSFAAEIVRTLGVGNRLLSPGALGVEIETGGSAVIIPLAGASDPDGDPIGLVEVAALPAHGTLTDNEDGTFTYASANDGARSDGVIFALTDGIHEVLAAASITISVPPSAPFAFNADIEVLEDTPRAFQLVGGDQDDPYTFAIAIEPEHGELQLSDPAEGDVVYIPDANYVGLDSFAFTVSGGEETSAPATIAITVLESDLDDDDGDGLEDRFDNCRELGNPTQADQDLDGLGDACDDDTDGDGQPDVSDLCPHLPAASHVDTDADGIGDACDADDDNDGVADRVDVCRWIADADQADLDEDGLGDLCDDDRDGDAIDDADDNCPEVGNRNQWNTDSDELGDACDDDDDDDGISDADDVCPFEVDPDQADLDEDGVGDLCDNDRDSDGVPTDRDCSDDDPSVFAVQPYFADDDGDGYGAIDDVMERCSSVPPDGYGDLAPDNCPGMENPQQADSDQDGLGDLCDPTPQGGAPLAETGESEEEGCAIGSLRSRDSAFWALAVLALCVLVRRSARRRV